MEKENKYYFELQVKFYSNIDLNKIENEIGIKATRKVEYEKSKGETKCSKIFYVTDELNKIYTDEEFEKFVKSIYKNLNQALTIIKEEKGVIKFCVVFTQIEDKPCISLSNEIIKILSNLDASFDIDYA